MPGVANVQAGRGIVADSPQWAAMDADGEVYLYPEKPEDDCDQWMPVDDDAIKANDVLDIDTTGIDWCESLTARPEGV